MVLAVGPINSGRLRSDDVQAAPHRAAGRPARNDPCPRSHRLTFETLGLSPDLLRAVAEEGYTTPTPVQIQAIPLVLEGRDVLAAAQTGTGKTAAFVLPIFERLKFHANMSFSPARHPTRVLVLTPTRELAMQVDEMARTYGKYVPLRVASVYGGVPIEPQLKDLRAGVEFLVATPGRLLDHVGQRTANLGQNLLFSATFNDEVRSLVGTFMHHPATVEVAPRDTAAEGVRQIVYPVDRDRKEALLAHLIRRDDMRQVLVFTRTKIAASRLAARLDRDGIQAVAIHSDRTQPERIRALEGFKNGDIRVLVATDVAARGLDIEDLPHVVNFELPPHPQDYIHRVGRTGRAGATGDAISLVSLDEADYLRGIQRLLRRAIPWTVEDGFVPVRDRENPPRPRTVGGRDRNGTASDPSRRPRAGGRSRPGRSAASRASGS